MTKGRLNQFLALGAAVLLIASAPPSIRAAAPATATVVGAATIELRACPQLSCTVRTTAPLGAQLVVRGEEERGFVPVEYAGQLGYALPLYLATDLAHVPYLQQGQPGCKRVALIFNVGVGFDPAVGILDTLKIQQVPASMFVMGWWADQHPAVLTRMLKDGFLIGSHGYDAIELPTRQNGDVTHDIEDAAVAINHVTGRPPARLFTPYAAAMDERVRTIVATEGYLPVSWTVTTDDYRADATEAMVYDRIMGGISDGAIVELHLDAPASAVSTGRAVPRVIAELRTRGYRFVTIPEMAQPCP